MRHDNIEQTKNIFNDIGTVASDLLDELGQNLDGTK